MATTFVFVLFLGFVLGGMMLMLAPAYLETERERARQAQERRAAKAIRASEAATAIPGFFAGLDATRIPPVPLAFDDALLAQLERHVRAEQAIVTQFVRYPSIDSLYRQEGSSFHLH